MKNFTTFLRQVDSFCAKLNAGLMAVALVLAVLVAAAVTTRMPKILKTVQQAMVTAPAKVASPAAAVPDSTENFK